MSAEYIVTTVDFKGTGNYQFAPINLKNINFIDITTYGAGQPDEILKVFIQSNYISRTYFIEEKEFLRLKKELYSLCPDSYIELIRRCYTYKNDSDSTKILSSTIINHAKLTRYSYKYRRYGKINNVEVYNRGGLSLEWRGYWGNIPDINLLNSEKFKSFMITNHNIQPTKWDITQFTDIHGTEYLKTLQEYMTTNVEGE